MGKIDTESFFFSKIDNQIEIKYFIMRVYFLLLSSFLLSWSALSQSQVAVNEVSSSFSETQSELKKIQLEEIWDGTFRTRSLFRLYSLKNGQEYTVLERSDKGTQKIQVYDYKSGEAVRVILDTSEYPELSSLFTYYFSPDESKLILGTKAEPLYRRSVYGIYYVLDVASGNLKKVSPEKIIEPHFNKQGNQLAYASENNLFVWDFESESTTQITNDGKTNHIINGIADWVYEEEFAIVRMFDWSPDGKYLAYIKTDETDVPEFSMDVYGKDLYQTQQVFKYPKAGEVNSKVSLYISDVQNKSTQEVDFSGLETAYYIPRLKWTHDEDKLAVQLTNRHQNILDLVYVNPNTGAYTKVLQEKDESYIDVTNDWTFMEDGSFFWTSERDGWNHLYHYNQNGKLIRQVTNGDWDVTRFYGLDTKTKSLYYQSTERGSIYRDVYSVKTNGRSKKQLSHNKGTNSADFSADFSLYVLNHSNSTSPAHYTLNESKTGKQIRSIVDNFSLLEKLAGYDLPKKEFGTIHISGEDLNMYSYKPVDFDQNKKYPVLLYQYSGPGSQSVSDSWLGSNDYWHQMLTQEGYIVVCVDGRGTGYKGSDFKKLTQLELGKYEIIDQKLVAEALAKESYVDGDRIGIWGWSYGGFMSLNGILQYPDVFSTAIAVAPVTSWRYYDTIYTERYMKTPQENPLGYDDNSPITYAKNLKGNLLLVHGTADDNVHVDNSMKLIEALIEANKDFDWLIYPDKNHGIGGGFTRLHLYRKMTDYILNNL